MPTYESLSAQREEVAYFMRRLYRQGLTTTSGGNLSLRVDDRHVLLTPSALDKCEMQADQIALFTLDGENLTPRFKGSIETEMHLAVLRSRPDVMAVVHAHPVTATTFAAMDIDIDFHLTAEAYAILGTPVRVGYCIMGSTGLARLVADGLKNADVAIMKNHGIICAGKTMLAAFDRIEVCEAAAKMTWITRTMQSASPLSQENLDEIHKSFHEEKA